MTMVITAEDILKLMEEQIESIGESSDKIIADMQSYDLRKANNIHFHDYSKLLDLLKTNHNEQLGLRCMINLIKAADEEKHNRGAI